MISETSLAPALVRGAPPDMLAAALAYAARGWRVFPCDARADKPFSKRPLVTADRDAEGRPIEGTGWPKKATTDEATIRAWWRRWPNAMIGMAPGWAGAFVVDLDPKGESVEAVEARLAEALGSPLPAGPRTVTQSGGRHAWFARPEGAHFGNDTTGLRNIDIRCDAGYVILPPSRLANGNAYSWEGEPFTGAAPALPAGLLDLIASRRRRAAGAEPAPPTLAGPAPALTSHAPGEEAKRRYARAALDRIVAEAAGAPQGHRGTELFTAACQLGRFLAAGAISEREALAALADAADANGLTRDDGAARVQREIRRGLEAGRGDASDVVARLETIAREAGERRRREWAPEPAGYPEPRGEAPAPQPRMDGPEEGGTVDGGADLDDPVEEGVASAKRPASAEVAAPAASTNPPRRKRKPATDAGEDGAPPRARAMGYSTNGMNADWALVLMGSKAVVVHEQTGGPIEDRLRVISVDAFKQWFSNRFTETIAPNGDLKVVSWAARWLSAHNRRQYRGIEFRPGPDAEATEGYLNLWRGFAVEPRKGGSYAILRDHMLNNVCDGDEVLFLWVFGWFAHLLQRPRERIGTALVMRGKMGVGKTKVGEVMGSLIAAHYFSVDDPRYITGQFNAHMASCLLLQAEEAVWAGDKAAEGRLKGLVTSKFQMIENKGIDPIRIDNFVHLLMTSNEDWVVPAGKDERRFCVLDINPRCAQNTDYFREMDEELDAGGREALLHDLLTFDLSQVDLRRIPRTTGLLEQKLRSLDSVDSWWFERLMSGTTTRGRDTWLEEVAVDTLFDDYLATAEKIGIRRKAEQTAFGIKLRKLVPGLQRVRRTWEMEPGNLKRMWCYLLPDIETCRQAYVDDLGQPVDWGDADA